MSFFKYLYKKSDTSLLNLTVGKRWDYFISSYSDDERVKNVYDTIPAQNKKWIVFKEYNYQPDSIDASCFFCSSNDESEAIIAAWNSFGIEDTSSTICVDSTGFISPYLAFFIQYLNMKGFKTIDILYSEPLAYKDKENTAFSLGKNAGVRQVRGFEGAHGSDTDNDILIINSGYDSHLIASVAEYKKHAKKMQLIGFPSLRADMYQQCLLQINRAQESIGRKTLNSRLDILAPAHDPFIAADILKTRIDDIHARKPITNLYLSPLATKAQLIGIVLYCLLGSPPCPTSLLFPFTDEYAKETTRGISRTWMYTIEFP